MSNNNNNNESNNHSKNNLYRSLTNNNQWNQNTSNDLNGYRSLPNLRSINDNDKFSNDGFRSGGMLLESNFRSIEDDGFNNDGFRTGGLLLQSNFNGNHFLSNPRIDPFSSLMSNSCGKGFEGNMITNKTIDNNSLSMVNNDTISDNGPIIIAPAPIYSNIIDQDSIDTCCHLSKVVVQVIQKTVVALLEQILKNNELEIDFQVNKKNQFEFSGRVYTSSLSDYVLKIYKLKQKDKKGNVSVVEIRKVHGDEFGYYEFEALLLEKLQNKGILLKKHNTKSMFGMPLSMDLGSLTLDDEDDDMNEISDFSDNDIVSSMQENDEDFDSNLCQSMLETLYSKDSFREEYMHDAYQLSTYLKKDDKRSKNMINYILKNESQTLIKNILEPIVSNKLFCAFIIVHVLESINTLISKKDIKSKLNIPKSFKNDIQNINKIWSNDEGIQNNLGSISVKFTRSQQIERRCESILKLID